MLSDKRILILGAYGLAGRGITARLARDTAAHLIAAGRNQDKLTDLVHGVDAEHPVDALLLDATHRAAVQEACADVDFVINAVGPYARHGADIARAVIETGTPYIDCANEQVHYRRLEELDDLAKEKGVPLVTGAGAIPGCSTLLALYLAKQFPDTTGIHCCWLQYRHAFEESGLGSTMGGILEASEGSADWIDGRLQPVVMGQVAETFDFPEPFGRMRVLEIPTLDALVIPKHAAVRDQRNWIYLGDMPTWMLGLIRLLQPHRRPWAYRLLETVTRRINDHETRRAITDGKGPEGLLWVNAHNDTASHAASILFRDGAAGTALLPVHLVCDFLAGGWDKAGLLTPADIVDPATYFERLEDEAVLKARLP